MNITHANVHANTPRKSMIGGKSGFFSMHAASIIM